MIGRRIVLASAASAFAWVAAAGAASRYESGPASADGTGRRYLGREIAQVMGWQGAAWLERSEREAEEQTGTMVAALGLKVGDAVADIGAGTGYVSRRLARAVGPRGRVDAVDVQPEMVRMLRDLAARDGLAQIRPRLGAEDDVKLDAASVDLAVMVDVYHELSYPFEVLASIVRALKPGGRVVFVEYRAEDANVPIKRLHTMSLAQVRREAAEHPQLAFERSVESLPWQHMAFFRKNLG